MSAGWHGIIPGITTIKDAINLLGGTCETCELANGFAFDFDDGLIRVTTLEQTGVIGKLWISGKTSKRFFQQEKAIPQSLDQCLEEFPKLHRTSSDAFGADIYESPGVRIALSSNGKIGSLVWIEFFAQSS